MGQYDSLFASLIGVIGFLLGIVIERNRITKRQGLILLFMAFVSANALFLSIREKNRIKEEACQNEQATNN